MNEQGYVAIIGAANIDISGRSTNPLIMEDSNPGDIRLCAGGVGRNVAENLARLTVDVRLVSSLGDDVFGSKIIEMCETVGIDMQYCYVKAGGTSSVYLALLENTGEMKLALSDMSILEQMPTAHLDAKAHMIDGAAIIVLDTGLPEHTIAHILANFGHKRIFMDPVSIGKAKHVKSLVGGFDTIKLNRLEAEFLSDIAINGRDSLERAGEYFLNKGVRRVFISMGEKGVFYKTAAESGMFRSNYIRPVNVTGAGDAFLAGIVYCTLHGWDNRRTAQFASAMSRIAILSESTVSPRMSVDSVIKEISTMEVAHENA